MTVPDLIVIGAARSGTTSLHHYLGQHPDIFMCPVKEPNYFAFAGQSPKFRGAGTRWFRRNSVHDPGKYRALFAGAHDEKIVVEVSPLYLHAAQAPARIKEEAGDARLIAVLRHPVERAYAAFMGARREGVEPCDQFLDAINDEPRRLEHSLTVGGLVRKGFYCQHLSRYYELFDHEQIRVYLYEDLVADPYGLIRDIFGFVGIDEGFVPDMSRRYNRSGTIRNSLLRAFWTGSFPLRNTIRPYVPETWRDAAYFRITKNVVKPPMPAEARDKLMEVYREDITGLAELLGRDLSHWLGAPACAASATDSGR